MDILADMTEHEIKQETGKIILEYAREPAMDKRIRAMAFDLFKWKTKLYATRNQLTKSITVLERNKIRDHGVRIP